MGVDGEVRIRGYLLKGMGDPGDVGVLVRPWLKDWLEYRSEGVSGVRGGGGVNVCLRRSTSLGLGVLGGVIEAVASGLSLLMTTLYNFWRSRG